jgi:CBS domain-containing protein
MTPEYSAMDILSWMEEYKVSHLPVVKGKKFLGLISEEDIFSIDDPEASVGENCKFFKNLYVQADQHLYEVIKLMSENKLSVVPVLGSRKNYLGVITPQAVLQKFSGYAAVNQPGGIIILKINNKDYFASQIVQIIESNDARLLSLFVSSEPDSTQLDVTLKVNKIDLSAILQTFNRYGYEVKASFFDEDNDYLQDRYDSLMNYLSI